MRTLAAIFSALAVVYLGLCVLLFFFQRSLLYFPQTSPDTAATTIKLSVDGERILVAVKPREGSKAVIYFGGNAEHVSYSLPEISEAFPDHAIYLLHYRGYGGSTGKPSESALFADAATLFDKVRKDHANITIVGRSLGSGVAVHLASIRAVDRLVLVTPYNSIQGLAERQFPFFPVRWLLQDKFDSWRYAGKVTVPTLLVAAEHDEIIPMASTQALHAHFSRGMAELVVVPGTGHNTISNSFAYSQILRGAR